MIQGDGPLNKVSTVGAASLNLAELAPVNEEKELEISIPLSVHGSSIERNPSLCVPFHQFSVTLSIFVIYQIGLFPF